MALESVLSERERAVLAAVCDGFHPALTAEPGDDPELFAASCGELGVMPAAESAIALLAPSQQAELRQFLRLLDNAIAGYWLAGTARSITQLSVVERGRLLNALATSPLPQLRSGCQALKRLSSFLFYSVTGADERNRALGALGYSVPTCSPSPAPRLKVTTIADAQTIDADVCIVGSGAGGGVVAAALAAKGMHVVVLEAGPGSQAEDFPRRELDGMQRLYLESGLCSSRDLGVAILAGACLGGGTTVNWQTCLRTPDAVRDEWAERSRCRLFADDRFSRAIEGVWSRIGASTNESIVNDNNAALRRGCDALGYSWEAVNRNAHGCDDTLCGYCTFGCPIAGKQSTAVTYLHDAQRIGDCTVIAGCEARRVLIEGGRATGVGALAHGARGEPIDVTIRAPRVVVAAGGIQSPALLLRSGISLPQLGRNLFLHPTTGVTGTYAERVETWRGPPQTIVSNQFARIDGDYGFRLETAPAHPGLLAFSAPWTSAAQHRRTMQRTPNVSAIIALTRDAAGGRVRVRRDGSPVIDYVPDPAEQRRISRGIVAAARVHLAAGALEIQTPHVSGPVFRSSPRTTQADIDAFCDRILGMRVDRNWSLIFSAHQMGTCRMGSNARLAVCDERGEVFGVKNLFVADASAFPGSSGVNPMITAMALASCIAEGIDR